MTESEIKAALEALKSAGLETQKIDIDSPVSDLVIGQPFAWSGQFNDGYQEGVSNIVRFLREVTYWNGVLMEPSRMGSSVDSVWMELDNGKKFLIGHFKWKNVFVYEPEWRDLL